MAESEMSEFEVDVETRRRSPRRRVAMVVAAVLAFGATFAASPEWTAASERGEVRDAGNGNIAYRPTQSHAEVVRYWTAERMASARPAPQPALSPAAARGAGGAADEPGPAVSVPGAAGSEGAGVAGPEPTAANPVPRPYTNLPDRLNGKVFFSSGGLNFVCSGTAINNPRKNLVWTAGHCVHGGPGAGFHQNWAFVPAFNSANNNQRPFGTWTAFELTTRTAWSNNGEPFFRQDVGTAILNLLNGERIGDVIGGQGISFNQPAQKNYSSFGYPQAAPFNGQLQFRCNSVLLARDNTIPGPGPAPMKIDCNMTGGASGGGWLFNLNQQGLGTVRSVNSYKYNNDPNSVYGPYHGNEALSLYDFSKDRGPQPK